MITLWLVSTLTRLDQTKQENMLVFAYLCSEADETNLVKLGTTCTVILPPMVSSLIGRLDSRVVITLDF